MDRSILEFVGMLAMFSLLSAGVLFAFDAWTRQQQIKLMRASNTHLLKRFGIQRKTREE